MGSKHNSHANELVILKIISSLSFNFLEYDYSVVKEKTIIVLKEGLF